MMVKSNKTNAVTPRYNSKNMKRSRQHPNSNNASTSSGRAVVAPTSPVAMGKALVLLATSCAALSSSHHHHHPPQPVATSTTSSQRRGGRSVASSSSSSFRPLLRNNRLHRDNDGHGEFHSSMVALHYRDGDDDQPVDVREANRNAVDDFASSSATGKSDIRARASSLPSLNLFTFPLPSIMPLVRINLPSMPSSPILTKEEKEQLLMDEYIEFAEKRYSRMHPEYQGRRSQPKHHPKKQAGGRQGSSNHQEGDGGRSRVVLDFTLPRKIFLSTLFLHRSAPLTILPTMASSSSSASSEPKPTREEIEEEDPLNVLGLSDLASARLRQRLHVPRDLRDEHMLIASSTQSAVNFLTYCVNTGRPLVHAHPSAEGKEVSSSSSSSSTSSPSSDAVAADGGRTSSYIALSFPAQFKLLVGTMRRLLVAFVRTVRIMTAFAKRACEEILNKGGFRNTVQLASVASVAILFMFKPLFKGAMKQG
mmetsp:Transcript_31054/g.57526  ORF Transcript_31054/g.57526 Transcript_31054/m.57526 type:complete len:479 (+) Transcript_31054:57-1493(+)